MNLADHWDTVYRTKDTHSVSWYQARPDVSLELLDRVAGVDDAIVDVGAGASTLVDHLLRAGHRDITLVDISSEALDVALDRIAPAQGVQAEVADLRAWSPGRQYDVWHDRAVFHFATTPEDQAAYRRALWAGLRPGGHAIVATFHRLGPERCSDLDTARYDAEGLLNALGGPENFELVHAQTEQHPHPRGGTQLFQVVLIRRRELI